MPKFKEKEYDELKQYLKNILSDENENEIINSIVNNETDKLWKFVVRYKLIAHLLDKKRIKDPELAYLTGKFLGYYIAVEKLFNKYKSKKEFEEELGDLIAKDGKVLDLLSDLYMIPSLSDTSIVKDYDKDIAKKLKEAEIIKTIESPVERYYMLTDEARIYMKNRYYSGIETEEKKKKDTNNESARARALYLLRKQNKKGGQNEKNFN